MSDRDWLIACWLLFATVGPDRMDAPWLAVLIVAALTSKVWIDGWRRR